MLRIKPFAALRPRPDLVEEVVSLPYDVMDRDEARAMSNGNPHSFLHVIRSEIGLDDAVSAYDPSVYDAARANLARFVDEGVLEREGEERVYLYRQEAMINGKKVSQTGVVACCHVEDYLNNVILKHEKTRQAKEDDRTNHTLAINANPGPVFLMHEDTPGVRTLVESGSSGEPLYDMTAIDGVRHTVWRTDDASPFVETFAKIPVAYVADGHHRSASAARAGAERRASNPEHTGDEEYNWFLCVLFEASQLEILGYHRVVKGLNGLDADGLIEKLKTVGTVTPVEQSEPDGTGRFHVYAAGSWHRVVIPADSIDTSDPVAALDYQILYDRVLAPILGIGDIRTDDRIDFVGGIRGVGELASRVDSGRADVAFAMAPVTIDQLVAVSDAGMIMSPKSTWFEPKLRSGFFVHTLD
ncbi:MAG: DUF1015 family protein [Planctomycetota bacterium]